MATLELNHEEADILFTALCDLRMIRAKGVQLPGEEAAQAHIDEVIKDLQCKIDLLTENPLCK